MIEIQCTSCHTRYRIDERVLPGEAPTFKCSRCGHVFISEPGQIKSGAAPGPTPQTDADKAESSHGQPSEAQKQHPYIRPVATARPKPSPAREDFPASTDSPEPDQRASQNFEQDPEHPGQDPTGIRSARPEGLKRSSEWSEAHEESGSEPSEGPAPSDRDHETSQHQGDTHTSVPPWSQVEAPHRRNDSSEIGLDRSREDFAPRSDEQEHEPLPENLSFDFDDDDGPRIEPEDEPQEDSPESRWKVGDEAGADVEERHEAPAERRARRFAEGPDPSRVASIPPRPAADESALLSATRESVSSLIKVPMDDGAERLLDRSGYHSAGWFLGLFFLVAVLFAGATMAISGTPMSSARLLRDLPVIGSGLTAQPSLESKVTLDNVHAYYEHINGNRLALVIAGKATSRASAPLHLVQLDVRVMGAGDQPLVARSIYCGQTLSEKMISEMTPQELEFLQKLGPQKSFVLDPDHSAPFVTVFIDPPGNIKRFTVAVTKASAEKLETASNEKVFP